MNESDVQTYNRIALGINAPIYAYYAGCILEKTGIVTGTCLDVGCGGGYLGLALAEITDLKVVFLDRSPGMLGCAAENIRLRGMSGRGYTASGEVEQIPLADASIDLVVSRGSMPFWSDLPAAFREINRILAPGGYAYIGGGLGPPELREALREQLCSRHPEWHARERTIPQRENREYREALQVACIEWFTVTRSDVGLWIEFRKGTHDD